MGSVANLSVGVGTLYFGAVGAVEPTNTITNGVFSDAISSSVWVGVGYTEEGHSFAIDQSYEDIEVAEELDPVLRIKGSRDLTLSFESAEPTAKNIQKALNGGTITTITGGGVKFTPPAAGAPDTRVAILWESNDKKERWVYRKCINTGGLEIARRKTDKATLGFEFKLEVPASGSPFEAFFSDDPDTV